MFKKRSNSVLRGVWGRTTHARSITSFLCRGAVAMFFCLLVLGWSVSANATWILVGIVYEDGEGGADNTEYYYNTDTGETAFWTFYTDGTEQAEIINPNPEDPSSGMKGDYDSAVQLAKQNSDLKGIVGDLEVDFESTPAGQHRTGKGKGLDPVHNPAGGDDSGARIPSLNPNHPDPLGKLDMNPRPVGGGEGWFNPNGGSPAAQLKKHGNKRGDQGGGDDGNSDPTNGDGLFGGLPGPPELVNPDPVSRGFLLLAPVTTALGSSRKGSRANLPSLGKLGYGGGFHLGPVSIGGPVGVARPPGVVGPAGAGGPAGVGAPVATPGPALMALPGR